MIKLEEKNFVFGIIQIFGNDFIKTNIITKIIVIKISFQGCYIYKIS